MKSSADDFSIILESDGKEKPPAGRNGWKKEAPDERKNEESGILLALLAIIAAPLGLRAYLYTGALGSYVSADGQRALRLRWHVTCDEANKILFRKRAALLPRHGRGGGVLPLLGREGMSAQ